MKPVLTQMAIALFGFAMMATQPAAAFSELPLDFSKTPYDLNQDGKLSTAEIQQGSIIMIQNFDQNYDGLLNLSEFKVFTTARDGDTGDKQLLGAQEDPQKMFRTTDIDGNQLLTVDEMLAAAKRFDKTMLGDCVHEISDQEHLEEINMLMAEVDQDKDGLLSYNEVMSSVDDSNGQDSVFVFDDDPNGQALESVDEFTFYDDDRDRQLSVEEIEQYLVFSATIEQSGNLDC